MKEHRRRHFDRERGRGQGLLESPPGAQRVADALQRWTAAVSSSWWTRPGRPAGSSPQTGRRERDRHATTRGTIVLLAAIARFASNMRAFDLPSAWLYDVLCAARLEGFYTKVAREVMASCTSGLVLEVGSGTGRVAARLAQLGDGLTVLGIDVSQEMVERATEGAKKAGIGGRARFAVGDVGALPLPDARFDRVVSTLSLHHWPDPARGLAEVHRVLKPGGEAWIYDIAGPVWKALHGGVDLGRLAEASPFGGGTVEAVRWPGRLTLLCRLRTRVPAG